MMFICCYLLVIILIGNVVTTELYNIILIQWTINTHSNNALKKKKNEVKYWPNGSVHIYNDDIVVEPNFLIW